MVPEGTRYTSPMSNTYDSTKVVANSPILQSSSSLACACWAKPDDNCGNWPYENLVNVAMMKMS